MKRILIVLIILIAIFLAACQPTPEKPPVISGNDDHLNEAINATPLPTDVVHEDPDHKTDSFTCLDTNVTVTVDAEIVKPETNVFPVYRAEASPIPDGFGRQIAEGVHPGVEFYERRGTPSVETLEARLEEYRAFISDWDSLVQYYADAGLSREEAEETAAETKEDYENRITELIRMIAEARENPSSSEPAPADFMLHLPSYYDPMEYRWDDFRRQSGAFGNDSNGTRIRIYEEWGLDEIDRSVVNSTLTYTYGDKFWGDSDDWAWPELNCTEEEARETAESFVRSAGFEDYVLYRVTPRYNSKENPGKVQEYFSTTTGEKPLGYQFCFLKAINGVPIVRSGIVNEYAHVQTEARLTVVVTNDGVSYAIMKNRWELGELENENVSLLSFEEAYDSFVRQAKVEYTLENLKYEGAKKGTVEIQIRSIRLVYCAIQSVGGGYTMVPAWMFCGERIVDGELNGPLIGYREEKFDAERFMIINAIDGSRISGLSYFSLGDDMMY